MTRKPSTHKVAAVFLALAATTALGACSSSPTPPSSASSAPASSSTAMGQDPATWSPVEITPEMVGTTVELVVGQRAVFRGFPKAEGYEVEAGGSDVVALAIPQDPPTEVTGVTALKPGTATVTLIDVSGGKRTPAGTVTVTVNQP